MRLAVAGFMHESNTSSPQLADRQAFLAQSLLRGEAMLAEWPAAHHEVGAFLSSGEEFGYEPVPLIMAWATPSGPVKGEVFDEVTAAICEGLRRERPDGLLLALHGAMVCTEHLDADGEVLARIRAEVGPEFPLAVTFDLHGNLSPRIAQLCDLAIAYRTNPHVDQRQRGHQAAGLLARWVRGEIRPRLAMARPPFLVNIMRQNSADEPFAGFLRQAAAMDSTPGLLAGSFLPGFAYSDVPQIGPSVLVVADGDRERAQAEADAFAARLWEARAGFQATLPDAASAVRTALASTQRPVVLVDTGDNVGGGSAADGTVILTELLRQEARGFVVMLYAPEEVRACQAVGQGGTVAFSVGGKVDRLHGEPVPVSGVVRLLHDGSYTETQVRHGGKRLNHMGPTAVVELPGDNLLVLTSFRHPPFSLGALTCLGIEPEKRAFLVVKAAIAYRAAYGPIAGSSIIEVGHARADGGGPVRLPTGTVSPAVAARSGRVARRASLGGYNGADWIDSELRGRKVLLTWLVRT
ncbi:MAG: M81 family metallopeptidase [Gemmataceae bacterium]